MARKNDDMRPGHGWKYLAGAVWERIDGVRVHIGGLVKLPDGRCFHANSLPGYYEASRLIKINGGNRKRGLMAWAASLATK